MVSTMVETHTLLQGNTMNGIEPAIQFVFGHMVRLAEPLLTHYRSDLYHDALWLNEHATGTRFDFYWSVGETGTRTGTEELMPYAHAYRFSVDLTDWKITLTIAPTS